MFKSRLFERFKSLLFVSVPFETAIQMVPTGFSLEPPPGPAIPLVAIEKVLLNTSGMYGSIRGIAGSAVQAVPLLELDEEDSTDVLANDSDA